jgi:hypothetical protein
MKPWGDEDNKKIEGWMGGKGSKRRKRHWTFMKMGEKTIE